MSSQIQVGSSIWRSFEETPNDLLELNLVGNDGFLVMMSTETWNLVGGMDEGFIMTREDIDFKKRLTLAGRNIRRSKSPPVFHHSQRRKQIPGHAQIEAADACYFAKKWMSA